MKYKKRAPKQQGVRTQNEVAAILGITRRQVAVIEARALKKMRAEWKRLFADTTREP